MSEVYEFADFRLDVREHVLERKASGERVAIPDKAFETLCVLVRNAGRLVEKEELLSTVWADSFVEENNLNKSIHAIRRALGENNGDKKFIETVKKHGFRFVVDVKPVGGRTGGDDISRANGDLIGQTGSVREFPQRILKTEQAGNAALAAPIPVAVPTDSPVSNLQPPVRIRALPATKRPVWRYAAIGILLVGLLAAAWLAFVFTPAAPSHAPTRLAVLPLKPIDAGDNYLGLGMADAIIRRISQTGTMTVRPTSSVRRYLSEEVDALSAARALDVDAVLEGTLQRSGDRLRVSVNLLRASDGKSLWADNFDMDASDAFTIQDNVAQQVAKSLQLRLDSGKSELLTAGYRPSGVAYEYYLKGIYSFDQRGFNIAGKPQHEVTIGLFKKSIEADPNYALAYAQLAYAYAWMAVYVDESAQDSWVELAKEEMARADALDPQLPETHIARHHVLLSAHEGYQTEAAIRELILAKKLNPNVAGIDLSVAYNHLGLEDMFDREMQRTLEVDPTSEFNKMIFGFQFLFAKRYDDWLAYRQKYYDGKPNVPYLMGKGRLDEARQMYDELATHGWDAETSPAYKGIMLALTGDLRGAEAEIPVITRKLPYKNNSYHHATYDLACINALLGHSTEAVKWLRETAETGFPSYPLFERDRYLDPIRQTPEFMQFMTEMKLRYESARREFAQ